MPNTISTLQQLGYQTGLAHGSVAVEQDALTAATAAAQPEQVAIDAAQVTAQTVTDLRNAGQITDDMDVVAIAQELAGEIAAGIEKRRSADVEFHQRAVQVAQETPDVWHVAQVADDGATLVAVYVNAKEDGTGWDDDAQAAIDTLADADQFNERIWCYSNPDAVTAANALRAADHLVERPEAGADAWTVDGGPVVNSAALEKQAAALAG